VTDCGAQHRRIAAQVAYAALKENRLAAKKGVLFAAQCTVAAAVLHNRFTNFV